MKRRALTTIIVATGLAAGTAHAQYYGGIVLNQPAVTSFAPAAPLAAGFNGGERPAELLALNPQSRGISLTNEPSLGMKLGYRLTPNFSLEARYTDKPGLTAESALRLEPSLAREKSMGLNLVGQMSFFKKLSVEGRAGFRSESFSAGAIDLYGASLAGANSGMRTVNSGLIGVGLQYNFNQSVGLRFEVERSRRFFGDRTSQDADNVSFGVQWRF